MYLCYFLAFLHKTALGIGYFLPGYFGKRDPVEVISKLKKKKRKRSKQLKSFEAKEEYIF